VPTGNDTFVTSSMAVAAYLHEVRRNEHGVRIRSARRVNGPGRFEFVFYDPDGMAQRMAVEFANSESRQFDDGMRSIKTLLSSSGRSR
jgi:hypothetical protein